MIKLKKRVFITGGFGQDGKIITKLLEKEKINLHIIAKSKKTIQKNKVYFIKSDLLDNKKIEKIFKKLKPDIVVHLASNNPSYSGLSNFTVNLLRKAHYCCLVYYWRTMSSFSI